MPRLIERLKLTNFLSFGPASEEIELGPLNVLIGPNASGKSNFVEAFSLLQALPTDLGMAFKRGGNSREWVWKGHEPVGDPAIEAEIALRSHSILDEEKQELHVSMVVGPPTSLLYQFAFRPEVTVGPPVVHREELRYSPAIDGPNADQLRYRYSPLQSDIHIGGPPGPERIEQVEIGPLQSILSQRKDPDRYHEITYLALFFSQIRLYRDWSFGAGAPARGMQPTDLPAELLSEDGNNLAHVLNAIQQDSGVKATIVKYLQRFHPDFAEAGGQVFGDYIQVFVQEHGLREATPATRLSDGTLRYLALLAILCHPKPPPLVCIEEPELGLHPDIIGVVAELLIEASERTQLVITTHSDLLVSKLSDRPEAVVVCEKDDRGTHLQRLDPERLREWLKDYSLGDLWLKGQIGGTRW